MIWSIWTTDINTEYSEDTISLDNIGIARQAIFRGEIADWRTLAIF